MENINRTVTTGRYRKHIKLEVKGYYEIPIIQEGLCKALEYASIAHQYQNIGDELGQTVEVLANLMRSTIMSEECQELDEQDLRALEGKHSTNILNAS